MATIFLIAWRNVLRNFRRSLITIISIGIGLIVLLVLWAFLDGPYNNAIDNFPLRYIGSIQIHRDGFFQRPKLETHIANPKTITNAVEAIGVDAWSVRLNSFALVAGEKTSTGMNFVGIDPHREGAVSLLDESIITGRFIEPADTYSAVLGAKAAAKLNVEVGDNIVMLSNDRRGAMTADRFEVVGLVITGDPTVDEMSVFVPLVDAQTMLAMEGRVTDVVVQVPKHDLDRKVNEFYKVLQGEDVEIIRWYEISPLVMDAQKMDTAFAWIFMGIVVAIAISGIANSILVSVMQRTREFGVLLALGSQRFSVALMIIFETLILGISGTFFGTILGLFLVKWLNHIGIDIAQVMPEAEDLYMEFGMDSVIYPVVNLDHLVATVVMMLIASVLSAIYPVWRTLRLEPIVAVRYV